MTERSGFIHADSNPWDGRCQRCGSKDMRWLRSGEGHAENVPAEHILVADTFQCVKCKRELTVYRVEEIVETIVS
jgi:hypothetical protein